MSLSSLVFFGAIVFAGFLPENGKRASPRRFARGRLGSEQIK
jgi:hypothetical protein